MRTSTLALAAAILALGASVSRGDDPKTADPQPAAPTPFVRIGNLSFFRSFEDAFARARKDGKLVVVYRMLGDLDGLT